MSRTINVNSCNAEPYVTIPYIYIVDTCVVIHIHTVHAFFLPGWVASEGAAEALWRHSPPPSQELRQHHHGGARQDYPTMRVRQHLRKVTHTPWPCRDIHSYIRTYIHSASGQSSDYGYSESLSSSDSISYTRPAAQPNLLQQQVLIYIRTSSHTFIHAYIQKVSVVRKVLRSLSDNAIQLFNDVSKDLKPMIEILDVSLRHGLCI